MIFDNKNDFLEEYKQICLSVNGVALEFATDYEKYFALCRLITMHAGELHHESRKRDRYKKAVYYFSMEFWIGKLLNNYLINYGIRDIDREGHIKQTIIYFLSKMDISCKTNI